MTPVFPTCKFGFAASYHPNALRSPIRAARSSGAIFVSKRMTSSRALPACSSLVFCWLWSLSLRLFSPINSRSAAVLPKNLIQGRKTNRRAGVQQGASVRKERCGRLNETIKCRFWTLAH